MGDFDKQREILEAKSIPPELAPHDVVTLDMDDRVDPRSLNPSTAYIYNECIYVTDNLGSLAYIEARVVNIPREQRSRDSRAQASARSVENDYVGGHPVGIAIGGHPSFVLPQNANMNVSAYKSMENDVSALASEGHEVILKIQFGDDPDTFEDSLFWLVEVIVDGEEYFTYSLLNEGHQFK